MSEPIRVQRDAAFTSAGNRTATSGEAADAPDVGTHAIAGLVAEGLRVVHHDVALAQAEERARAAVELLVNVTHDLRSPLASMMVLLERLRSGQAGPVSAPQERLLAVLYAAAFSMASLTGDTLELARGAVPPHAAAESPFSLRKVWRDVRDLVQPIAEARGLLLRFAGPAEDERTGPAATVQRVLLNLVTNALKYTDTGAVTVSIEDAGSGRLRFEVRDTGAGLPPQLQQLVNGPAQPFTDAPPASSGLGIITCQRLLGDLGGTLEAVESDRGSCLAFTLTLPPAPARALA